MLRGVMAWPVEIKWKTINKQHWINMKHSVDWLNLFCLKIHRQIGTTDTLQIAIPRTRKFKRDRIISSLNKFYAAASKFVLFAEKIIHWIKSNFYHLHHFWIIEVIYDVLQNILISHETERSEDYHDRNLLLGVRQDTDYTLTDRTFMHTLLQIKKMREYCFKLNLVCWKLFQRNQIFNDCTETGPNI